MLDRAQYDPFFLYAHRFNLIDLLDVDRFNDL